MPSLKVFVIGCVDPRVAPSHVLGLELGEAATIRNIGGRVTSSVLDELVLLRRLTQASGGDFDQGWTFVVLQHTDCGILWMQGERKRLAKYFGVDEGLWMLSGWRTPMPPCRPTWQCCGAPKVYPMGCIASAWFTAGRPGSLRQS
jgi:hypothetical protein